MKNFSKYALKYLRILNVFIKIENFYLGVLNYLNLSLLPFTLPHALVILVWLNQTNHLELKFLGFFNVCGDKLEWQSCCVVVLQRAFCKFIYICGCLVVNTLNNFGVVINVIMTMTTTQQHHYYQHQQRCWVLVSSTLWRQHQSEEQKKCI